MKKDTFILVFSAIFLFLFFRWCSWCSSLGEPPVISGSDVCNVEKAGNPKEVERWYGHNGNNVIILINVDRYADDESLRKCCCETYGGNSSANIYIYYYYGFAPSEIPFTQRSEAGAISSVFNFIEESRPIGTITMLTGGDCTQKAGFY